MDQNDNFVKQYMVEFQVPPLSQGLLDMIPEQRDAIDKLFTAGKLLSYSLSSDKNRLWAVMSADSESELLTYIDKLPMTPYMDYDYEELMFYNTVAIMPSMSLN